MPNESSRPRPFLSVMAEAHAARASGMVRVEQGGGRLSVALTEGRIVAVELEGGALQPSTGDDRELAALLAEAFAEGQASVPEAATRQTLLGALRSQDSLATLEEGQVQVAGSPLDLTTEDLLREAAHGCDVAVLDEALGSLDRPLILEAEPQALQQMALTPSEGYLISRLDGALTAASVLELVPQDAEAARRNLFGLVVSGVVRFVDAKGVPAKPGVQAPPASPPSPAPPSATEDSRSSELRALRARIKEAYARIVGERDHFEALGVTREASEAEVKAAYFSLVKQFHPDAHRDLTDLHEEVQAIFSRIGAAYEAIGQPRSRAAYEEAYPEWRPIHVEHIHTSPGGNVPRRPPPSVHGAPLPEIVPRSEKPEDLAWMAEEGLRRAEGLLGEGKFWEAIQILEGQVGALVGRSRHRGRLVLAQAYLHNPKWLHRAEELLRGVVKDDPMNAESYYLLGTIYRTGGLPTRAAAMFRKVLEVRPGHKPAADELLALEKAPPPPRR